MCWLFKVETLMWWILFVTVVFGNSIESGDVKKKNCLKYIAELIHLRWSPCMKCCTTISSFRCECFICMADNDIFLIMQAVLISLTTPWSIPFACMWFCHNALLLCALIGHTHVTEPTWILIMRSCAKLCRFYFKVSCFMKKSDLLYVLFIINILCLFWYFFIITWNTV